MPLTVKYDEVLDETADSIEALNSQLFVCGTYQLEETCKRFGSMKLYECVNGSVEKLQDIKTDAVLDMKWRNNSRDKELLTVADSCGNAQFYALQNQRLIHKSATQLGETELCLSTDWFKTANPKCAVYSLSSGDIALLELKNEGEAVVVKKWKAHSLEAWIVATDHHSNDIVYSGADDCLFRVWDVRCTMNKPLLTSKHYSMGVCSIQSHKSKENMVAVGSYDESVSVWDNRDLREPVSRVETGGGVWRIKWHPLYSNIMLTACMHDGFKIIKYENGLSTPQIICSYTQHQSLAYGADWLVDSTVCSNQTLNNVADLSADVASCSFYDKLLTVWEFSV